MMVTTEMIDAAIKKATEAGLLPRHARREDVGIHRELIRTVLIAALESERKNARAPLTNSTRSQVRNRQPAAIRDSQTCQNS